MADNYLEKRMEDYRAGKGAGRAGACRVTPRGGRPLELTATVCYGRVAVAVDSATLRDAIVEALAAVGCKTAFGHDDVRAGQALAQRVGALYVPAPKSDADIVAVAASRWGDIDAIVTDHAVVIDKAVTTIRIDALPTDTAASKAMADSVLWLLTDKAATVKYIHNSYGNLDKMNV